MEDQYKHDYKEVMQLLEQLESRLRGFRDRPFSGGDKDQIIRHAEDFRRKLEELERDAREWSEQFNES